ncbi:phenazine-specific anthranilate synthase component I [Streptomyces sp. SID13666]|uniref:anthranilate synthase family protein n=1 Tax=unclassified Streptomyces TaxID=2593676 RepID=UPI0013BF08B1|nr:MULTISPECIES: anthranilate synthase family protein [unclassified Streptomyces]NEA55073.1 phenazine-specific anthranilate synthase component I [Streptomyces sp. SID13666]NEA71080.1 phenazine-specific anthranilate synthase component I [Streptomyces sp. SID13588]
MTGITGDLLDRVLAGRPGAFALLHRPEAGGTGSLDVLAGDVSTPATLTGIPLPDASDARVGAHHEVLTVIPYRQITERGFVAPDDGAPLVALSVTEQERIPLDDALRRIPQVPSELAGAHFDVDDEAYEEIVRKVVEDVIGAGEGANFVIKRSFVATITDYRPDSALSFFSRLVQREVGAYWTFLIHTGERTLVGASPERHISLGGGTAVMNPISGTYRYSPTGPTLPEVMDFLADRKEADELYMVVDEELKMMARICESGGRVKGPYLKEMSRLAHTEYFIEGRTGHDVRDILRETMFAPTVTGSPLESACRIIDAYEPKGRGYYSGVAALIGRDEQGGRVMDSAILIRTADIDVSGRVEIGVGATLVRHSDPALEAAETRAKASTLVSALESGSIGSFADHPKVRAALVSRNDSLAGFWLRDAEDRSAPHPAFAGRRILVVDAEDTFTSMIAGQLRSMGLDVTVRRFDEEYSFGDHDLVVLGPGPGDPGDTAHPRIGHLHTAVRTLLAECLPFVAVCLSHQVLSLELGFEVCRLPAPNQGLQKEIDYLGSRERVGFYNAFAAHSDEDKRDVEGVGVVEISRDQATGEVYGLRGPHFMTMQFHAESVLTQNGPRILAASLTDLFSM